jgi:hypothetical protein
MKNHKSKARRTTQRRQRSAQRRATRSQSRSRERQTVASREVSPKANTVVTGSSNSPATAAEQKGSLMPEPDIYFIPHECLADVVEGRTLTAFSERKGAEVTFGATGDGRHLPSIFATDVLPSRAELEALISRIPCKCGGQYGVASYEVRGSLAAYLRRCHKCAGWKIEFISTDKAIDPGNAVIFLGNPKQYRQEMSELRRCHVCSEPNHDFNLGLETFRYKTLLPFSIRCTKCEALATSAAFVQEPTRYSAHNLRIAHEIVSKSPAAAYSFCISALEAFLLRAYILDSESRFNEVFQRRFSFQRLTDANKRFKESADHAFSLSELAGQQRWVFLLKAVEKRNCIVHNGGLDANLDSIVVTEAQVGELESEISKFIEAVDLACKQKCLY